MPRILLRTLLLILIISATVACDQSSKSIAKTALRGSHTIEVLGDFFVLHYTENRGAFLSIGANWPARTRFLVLVILTAVILFVLVVVVLVNKNIGFLHVVALSLVIGGGLGNLIDRFMYSGYVVDFMNLGIGGLRTGIFNFADLFVIVGILLLIIRIRKPDRLEQQ